VDLALHRTCSQLAEVLGEDAETWTWGALHTLDLKHPFAARSSLLSRWSMPPVPFPGNSETVAAAGYSWHPGRHGVRGSMASVRVVMPLNDLGASTFGYPGGQSGHPRHPDFRSHFDAFVNGRPLTLWSEDDDVARHVRQHMTLVSR
jgi:penicillin amidase